MNLKIDKLIRSKRKTLALEINKNADLIVRAPALFPLKMIQAFVSEKQNWIRAKQDQQRQKLAESRQKSFQNGESFLFLGERYELMIREQYAAKFTFQKGFVMCASVAHNSEALLTNWYHQEAQKKLLQRVSHYAQSHDLEYNEIKITRAKKRWGSCSSQKNLNFSWRLIMAPLEVIDYVVVHELAHTKEMNHSKRFWDLVEALYPRYQMPKKWLKNNGHQLTL